MAGVEILEHFRETIKAIALRYGASNLRVFGSFARGEGREDSDLDLLVDMDQDRSLLDTVGLVQDLSEALGRRVDVVTEPALHRLLRNRILNEAQPL